MRSIFSFAALSAAALFVVGCDVDVHESGKPGIVVEDRTPDVTVHEHTPNVTVEDKTPDINITPPAAPSTPAPTTPAPPSNK